MAVQIRDVKAAAHGHWSRIITSLAGISDDYLTTKHRDCPKCGGTDRWRVFDDFEQEGGAVCNQCGKKADGIALIQWARTCNLFEAVEMVGAFLGVKGAKKKNLATAFSITKEDKPAKKDLPNEAKQDWRSSLEWIEPNEKQISLWLAKKKPITRDALNLVGAKYARHKGSVVIAIPIIGQTNEPIGYTLYNITGNTLPHRETKDGPMVQLKVKVIKDKGVSGWMGRYLPGEGLVVKTEGPSDMLALLSINPDLSVVCNPNGAMEKPQPWMVDQLTDQTVWTIHDCDLPGQQGATEVNNEGRIRSGWAYAFASVAKEARNVVLPYPIIENHGKDLRDWIQEQLDIGFDDPMIFSMLGDLANEAPPIPKKEPVKEPDNYDDEEREHVDDPHRLARINLNKYENVHLRCLRYWKETWYSYSNGAYSEITTDHLSSRINFSVKEEFERKWREERDAYELWKKSSDYDSDSDKGPPKVRKVKASLIRDVLEATKGICLLNDSQKIHAWIKDGKEGFCISVKNGILNISKAISEEQPPPTIDDILIPHTKDWFSTAKLDFEFNPNAQCPRWHQFLSEGFTANGMPDQESIDILQMWFGYLLTPDNSLNKIMFIIGEKRSGKGTIIHIMRSLFGDSNIATPTLTELSKDFSMQQFSDKTVAIIADARLSDRVDQTVITEKLLSISGGDPQNIQRKYKDTLSAYHVRTRFTVFSNLVPRLKDVSAAFVSRCIFLRMPNSFYGREDLTLKDKLLAEMPGILNWAIVGRHKLNQLGRIPQSKTGDSLLREMKTLTSPLIEFIEDVCTISDSREVWIDTKDLYSKWVEWCEENDVSQPGTIQSLSRRIKAIKPNVDVVQYKNSPTSKRRRFLGISVKDDF